MLISPSAKVAMLLVHLWAKTMMLVPASQHYNKWPAIHASQGYRAPKSGDVNNHPVTKDVASHAPVTTNLLHKLADLLSNKRHNLPRMEPEMLTGESLQFPIWIKSFESIIESHTDWSSERLYFLSKYTSGAAREAIERFFSVWSVKKPTNKPNTC